MRLANVLALVLILQLVCTFALVHSLYRKCDSLDRISEKGNIPVVYEVGSPRGDIARILGRDKISPGFVEGFLAAKGIGQLDVETTFLREKAVWRLSATFDGREYRVEAPALSTACFRLLGEMHDKQDVLAGR